MTGPDESSFPSEWSDGAESLHSDPEWISALTALDLMPPRVRGDTNALGLSWTEVDYEDKYAGALIGGACGDALGRPAERRSPADIQARFGTLRDFVPWRGYRGGPVGTITDDTQMTMCIARSIIERGRVDPEDIARRFVDWLPEGRGKGRTCVAAIRNFIEGAAWHEAGVESAGNGAAMRAAPIGLLDAADVDQLRTDAALSAVVTHRDPMAVASTIAVAFTVAYCLHRTPQDFDVDSFARALQAVLADVREPGTPERRPGAGPDPVRLVDRLSEAFDMLDETPEAAFSRLHNGAFVLESLPAAVWCFAKHHDDPEAAIVTAANGGYDADTVASMAGNLVGALHGERVLPERWLSELEYRKVLRELADRIREMTR